MEYYSIFIYFIVSSVYLNETQYMLAVKFQLDCGNLSESRIIATDFDMIGFAS